MLARPTRRNVGLVAIRKNSARVGPTQRRACVMKGDETLDLGDVAANNRRTFQALPPVAGLAYGHRKRSTPSLRNPERRSVISNLVLD